MARLDALTRRYSDGITHGLFSKNLAYELLVVRLYSTVVPRPIYP